MTERKRFLYALAVYVGTIIGVGLFGLPFVGAKAGFFLTAALLLLVGLIAGTINSFYAEIAAKTEGLHRLPGYAEKYLGPRFKPFAFAVKALAIFGSLLAYLIIGGQFLANLFGGSVYLYTFLFFILGALLIWKDKKSIGPVELIMLFIFILTIIFIFIAGAGNIAVPNLMSGNLKNIFLPYGVLLFSLWGASIVPEVKEELRGDLKKVRKVVYIGIAICIAIYLLFNLLVIGVSGSFTSEDAISGLQGYLGEWIVVIGYVFGIIATFTSFITLGLTLKKLFWFDYKLPKWAGWALACFVPLALFIAGLQDFISVIGLTGAVMLGFDGIFVVSIYRKLKEKENKKLGLINFYSIVLIVFLSLGVFLEIMYFFNN